MFCNTFKWLSAWKIDNRNALLFLCWMLFFLSLLPQWAQPAPFCSPPLTFVVGHVYLVFTIKIHAMSRLLWPKEPTAADTQRKTFNNISHALILNRHCHMLRYSYLKKKFPVTLLKVRYTTTTTTTVYCTVYTMCPMLGLNLVLMPLEFASGQDTLFAHATQLTDST